MVRRYKQKGGHWGSALLQDDAGDWVKCHDYDALQTALREALKNWSEWNELHQTDSDRGTERMRIAALYAQFLDDK
jgi:hypothetical protein